VIGMRSELDTCWGQWRHWEKKEKIEIKSNVFVDVQKRESRQSSGFVMAWVREKRSMSRKSAACWSDTSGAAVPTENISVFWWETSEILKSGPQ